MINDQELVSSMDEFLASLEKRAFIMARVVFLFNPDELSRAKVVREGGCLPV